MSEEYSSLPLGLAAQMEVGPEQCVPLRRRALELIDYARDHRRLGDFSMRPLPSGPSFERAVALEAPDHKLSIALGWNNDVDMFNQLTFPAEFRDQTWTRIDACSLYATGISHVASFGTVSNPRLAVIEVAPAEAINLWNNLFDRLDILKTVGQPEAKRGRFKQFLGRLLAE